MTAIKSAPATAAMTDRRIAPFGGQPFMAWVSFWIRRSIQTIWFAGCLLSVSSVMAAVVPGPPSKLCIDNDASCVATPAPGGNGIKFHPGHYVMVETWPSEFNTQEKRFAFYDTLAKETTIAGVFLSQREWAQLEGARGDYSAGFRLLDAEIEKLASLGKRLIWNPHPAWWTSSGSTLPSGFIPVYLQSAEYSGGAVRCATGWVARIWEKPVGDRWIAMMNAYGARYDSHPHMEMVKPFFESAIPWNSTYPAPSSWNSEIALRNHMLVTLTEMRKSWPSTMLMANTSWIRDMGQLFAALPGLKAGAGGTDMYPHPSAYPGGSTHEDTESDRVYLGKGDDRGVGRGVVYKGVIPYMNENQDPVYSSKEGAYLPQELYKQGMLLGQTHFAWKKMWLLPDSFRGSFDRTDMTWEQYKSAVKWDTGILPFLRTNPPVVTTAPSALGTVNRN